MIKNIYHDSLILKRNVDNEGNPISIKITDNKQVMDNHSCIVLSQLPDEVYGLQISGFTEIFDVEKLSGNTYKVDYVNGIVYFNPVNIGKNMSITYYGIGCELIYSSRIATDMDSSGGVTEILSDLVEDVKNAVVTTGIIKENYRVTVSASSLSYNSGSGLYEYTLNHGLNSNKISVSVYDSGNNPCLDLCTPLDSNNLLVRNDEKIDLKITINYGSIS